jgi:hypothetical protein
MSPIDDELRAALHRRARVLDPSPDPLAGIERRARRMRRNRIGAAVAGSALAVTAVAGVVPLLQGTSPVPDRPPVATAAPTLEPSPEPSVTASPQAPDLSYALDPQDPWAFRGEPVEEGTRATIQDEYATKLQADEVLVTPLFASTYEPSGQQEVVFLARVDGGYRWGISTSSEAGPEFLWDEPLPEPALALTARLAGDEVDRLVVLSAPGTAVRYSTAGAERWSSTGGNAVGPVEGDGRDSSYELLDPDGQVLLEAPVPAPAPAQDADAFALDPADPWPYRGLAEPTSPNIAVEDERLFVATDPSRDDGSWSQRPLYYGDSDAGMSFLLVLHTKDGQDPVVTTTWQRGDREAEQTEQLLEPGQRVVQVLVPTDLGDGSVLLVALAAPQAGIALEQPGRGLQRDGIGDPGVGLWVLDEGEREGMIRLYDGGAEVYAEPVDVGPDAPG